MRIAAPPTPARPPRPLIDDKVLSALPQPAKNAPGFIAPLAPLWKLDPSLAAAAGGLGLGRGSYQVVFGQTPGFEQTIRALIDDPKVDSLVKAAAKAAAEEAAKHLSPRHGKLAVELAFIGLDIFKLIRRATKKPSGPAPAASLLVEALGVAGDIEGTLSGHHLVPVPASVHAGFETMNLMFRVKDFPTTSVVSSIALPAIAAGSMNSLTEKAFRLLAAAVDPHTPAIQTRKFVIASPVTANETRA